MSKQRKQHSKQTKFQAVIALLSGQHTLAELSQRYGTHQSVLQRWKKEFLDCGPELFDRSKRPPTEHQEIEALERKVGQLTMELDFLKKALGK